MTTEVPRGRARWAMYGRDVYVPLVGLYLIVAAGLACFAIGELWAWRLGSVLALSGLPLVALLRRRMKDARQRYRETGSS